MNMKGVKATIAPMKMLQSVSNLYHDQGLGSHLEATFQFPQVYTSRVFLRTVFISFARSSVKHSLKCCEISCVTCCVSSHAVEPHQLLVTLISLLMALLDALMLSINVVINLNSTPFLIHTLKHLLQVLIVMQFGVNTTAAPADNCHNTCDYKQEYWAVFC